MHLPQNPCDCDPYDHDEAVILSESCGRKEATGRECYEVNVAINGIMIDRPGVTFCTYYLQKKTEYHQRCSLTFQCFPFPIPCSVTNYLKCTWESELVDSVGPVPCGQNPFSDIEPKCLPVYTCP